MWCLKMNFFAKSRYYWIKERMKTPTLKSPKWLIFGINKTMLFVNPPFAQLNLIKMNISIITQFREKLLNTCYLNGTIFRYHFSKPLFLNPPFGSTNFINLLFVFDINFSDLILLCFPLRQMKPDFFSICY